MNRVQLVTASVFSTVACVAMAQSVSVGPAPKGDNVKVASRIIKENFPTCKRVTRAVRGSDGSIYARCDAVDYMVFTMTDHKKAKTHEVALNCNAAKELLKVSCSK